MPQELEPIATSSVRLRRTLFRIIVWTVGVAIALVVLFEIAMIALQLGPDGY